MSDYAQPLPPFPTPERINSITGAHGKRTRRQRSYQGSTHYNNGHTGKKGANGKSTFHHDKKNGAPIFLQKTFELINKCTLEFPDLACWSEDGLMFVIKDQKRFENDIIPKFFDHNKFASFARQLNFYGFRKVQTKSIYKDDIDEEAAKHVTFCNDKFQRDRAELLKDIQRSTKGVQNNQSYQELQKEISDLKLRCDFLETRNQENAYRFAQIETQLQQFLSYSAPTQQPGFVGNSYGNGIGYANVTRSGEKVSHQEKPTINNNGSSKASLPRHPNAKDLPLTHKLPPPPNTTSDRQASLDLNFLRGLSTYDFATETETELSPFDQKYLTSALTDGAQPTNGDHKRTAMPDRMQSRRATRPADMERQVSSQFGSISLEEFPPLST